MSARPLPPIRPEYVAPLSVPAALVPAAAPALARRALGHAWLRKSLLLLVLAALWEALARWKDKDLLLPGALPTARAFAAGMVSGELPGYVAASLAVLVQGYALGVAGALLLTSLAIDTRFGRDLLETLTAMFNPLPAIALLPLALLWFGLGRASLVFVLVHSWNA